MDLDNRHLPAEHENNTHLQKHPERVPNVVGAEFLEALSAIASLQQEGVPEGRLPQPVLEAASLAGEHDRRERF